MLGAAGLTALRACRRGRSTGGQLIGLATVCGMAAFLVTLLTGHSLLLHEGQVTFFPLVGLAFLTGREWADRSAVARAPRWQAFIVPVAALVLLATLPGRLASAVTLQDIRTSGMVDGISWPGVDPGTWTGRRASIDLPPTARAVTVMVRFAAPLPQSIDVELDGRFVERVSGSAGQSLQLRYVVPRDRARTRWRRLDLTVSPTWTPPGVDAELGVLIPHVQWHP
jgi:hypothetical protein